MHSGLDNMERVAHQHADSMRHMLATLGDQPDAPGLRVCHILLRYRPTAHSALVTQARYPLLYKMTHPPPPPPRVDSSAAALHFRVSDRTEPSALLAGQERSAVCGVLRAFVR
jgi:hypothetical protein